MQLSALKVQNYKGLRDVEIPLSRFSCLIGENNAGKSSVLQALALFFSGTVLNKSHYFEDSKNIRIELRLTGVNDVDVNRLADEHQDRVRGILTEGAVTLVRLYG